MTGTTRNGSPSTTLHGFKNPLLYNARRLFVDELGGQCLSMLAYRVCVVHTAHVPRGAVVT